MQTSNERRLNDIIVEIQKIYLESRETKLVSKKYENYNIGTKLINEAKELIENLQKEINIMCDTNNNPIGSTNNSNMQINRLNEYIDLLSHPNLNFSEVMHIIGELKAINGNLPTKPKINENIEKEVFYVEELVDEFE